MKARIYKLFSSLIIALVMIGVSSCGNDFDDNPQLENRTIYEVESVTFNDTNLDNVENYSEGDYRSVGLCYSPTLKAYYENYFNELHLLAWDNGKYEVNVFGLRESTDPQKPTRENGKIRLNFTRTKHNESFTDKGFYYGTIKLVEVGHNRYDCEVYDDEYNITFSATIQLDEGVR